MKLLLAQESSNRELDWYVGNHCALVDRRLNDLTLQDGRVLGEYLLFRIERHLNSLIL